MLIRPSFANALPNSLQLGSYTIHRALDKNELGLTYLAHDNDEDKDVILEDYALAATFRHIITGEQPPHSTDRGANAVSTLPLHLNPNLQGDFSAAFLRSIDKGFAVQADERWQTVQEWLDALPQEPKDSPACPPKDRDCRTVFLG